MSPTLTCVETYVNLASGAAIILGVIFGLIELHGATRARRLDAFVKLFEELRSDDFVQGRKLLYRSDIPELNHDSLSDDQRRELEYLINMYNKISFLVEKRLVPRTWFLELWSGGVLSAWSKTHEYVRERRVKSRFSDWAASFERMAGHCADYRRHELREEGVDYEMNPF